MVHSFNLRRWPLALGALVLATAIILGIAYFTHSPEARPPDPHPDSTFELVALGDSYISGEGATHYFPGTDLPGKNMCHRAATAYPYLIAERVDASLTFPACSGARTADVLATQLPLLAAVEDPDVVLISIGGNDAGFAEVGIDCATPLFPDCRGLADRWLRRLDADVYPALVRTYRAVRAAASGAPVFALTYPNPLGPRSCPLAGLGPAEMAFLREVFVGRLNQIVSTAARAAGVRVIDLTDSLAGYRFCERPLGETAVNFVEIGRSRGAPLDVSQLGGLAHGSLHPNEQGHELIEPLVRRRVEAVQEGGFARPPQPHPDLVPPPFQPDELGSPGQLPPFPPGTECGGTELSALVQLAADPDRDFVSLTGLAPRSTVCFRTYRDEWESKRASAKGAVQVPIDVSRPGVASINEVLVEEPGGAWKKLVVSRLSSG